MPSRSRKPPHIDERTAALRTGVLHRHLPSRYVRVKATKAAHKTRSAKNEVQFLGDWFWCTRSSPSSASSLAESLVACLARPPPFDQASDMITWSEISTISSSSNT